VHGGVHEGVGGIKSCITMEVGSASGWLEDFE
jgi:hypothetical protein